MPRPLFPDPDEVCWLVRDAATVGRMVDLLAGRVAAEPGLLAEVLDSLGRAGTSSRMRGDERDAVHESFDLGCLFTSWRFELAMRLPGWQAYLLARVSLWDLLDRIEAWQAAWDRRPHAEYFPSRKQFVDWLQADRDDADLAVEVISAARDQGIQHLMEQPPE